ncbi:MAG: aldo/keto reductase [Alphaproteobacteria bacterium]|nr:aldo/keto reductase [Alphaproteobacteria bacterium]
MQYKRLGRSGLRVSDICLGTMTMGGQVSEVDSLRMLDRAFDAGVNFIDSAEQYASPPTPQSYGKSEEIVGKWLKGKQRDAVIVTSKITGPNDNMYGYQMNHIRHGLTAFDHHMIERAVDGSLRRLGTDYIDLYQTHWPDRHTPMEAQLDAMERIVEAGKVRYFGVSNETPWGLTRLAAMADHQRLPRVVSIQNLYNVIQRDAEIGLSEVCLEEGIGFMAYSILAMGVLTGKYSGGALPKGTRLEAFPRYRSWVGSPAMLSKADRFVAIARDAGLDPAVAAIAWVRGRPFVTTALSSATRQEQVETFLAAADVTLTDDVLDAIEQAHQMR